MRLLKGSRLGLQKHWMLGLFFLIIALAACSKNPAPEVYQDTFINSSVDDTEVVEAPEDAIIATLKLDNGNVIRFVNEVQASENPHIGVLEITAVGQTSSLAALEASIPTPLELFLAFSSLDAPAALIKDHTHKAKLNQASLEPRKLQASDELSAQAARVGDCIGLTANLYHQIFRLDEQAAFGIQLAKHGHGQNLLNTHYGVTGLASRRALGTCNAGGYVKSVRIEYQWTANLWINVPLGVTWLFPGQTLFYYSNSSPAIYKYRIKVGFTANVPGNSVHTEGSWQ
jgi:hypothetical protein